jgi:uncharacterized cupredoxin-like copper-binding protein
MRLIPVLIASSLSAGAMALAVTTVPAVAHGERHFSAGEPGDPSKPARIVRISMHDEGKRMFYEPAHITVRKGEQIRFVFYNDGIENHEFVLATVKENQKHAADMKKNPHMVHDDPNAITLAPLNSGEIVWKFTKAGTFEYACLIPGHLDAGMHGTVVVK